MQMDGRSYLANEDGAVAAMYAIALTGLIVIAGAAFDYGRVAALDTELQGAADQAGVHIEALVAPSLRSLPSASA